MPTRHHGGVHANKGGGPDGCFGKQRFATPELAAKRAAKIGGPVRARVYPCTLCNNFHLDTRVKAGVR